MDTLYAVSFTESLAHNSSIEYSLNFIRFAVIYFQEIFGVFFLLPWSKNTKFFDSLAIWLIGFWIRLWVFHCVKTVQIWSFFWSVFSLIRIEYRRMKTRKNDVFGHFSHRVLFFKRPQKGLFQLTQLSKIL